MNLTRLIAIVKKETLHILRDRRSTIAAFLIPLVLMVMYCSSLSLDVNNIPTAIMDYDKTSQSRNLISKFTSSGYFSIVSFVDNYHQMQKLIDRGKVVMGLSIPRNFSKLLKVADKPVPIQILLDGTDPNRGATAMGYTAVISQNYSQKIIIEQLEKMGITQKNIPVNAKIRIWFNPSLRSKNFLVPGLIAMIMAILAALLTSTTISREWENGTMELLISTPVSNMEIILGKFIPYFIIGLIDCIVIITVGYLVYNVPIKGSLILLVFVILVFISGVLMLGLFISCNFRSTLLSTQVAFLANFIPTMLLSGFIFFIPGMPKILQALSYIIPAKYFIICTRGIFNKGVGIKILFLDILFLIIFDAIVILLTIKKFKKTLDVN